ncbi:putative AAA+ superfamily ATPase [Methanocalculus alkaliphilus]|uniref:ATP-binding protein n=1 Tax=Methanocalculus alkaliphilus TaxID=768730 RepID=UPI00209DE487|nr:ATP-binding protein [Methanocalculus alkaliphilus]MCP1714607.1 putative AAA+ superfamily ATPase [Methanocalculus alkaliphilus]
MDTVAKLKAAIVEWQERDLPTIYPRQFSIQLELPHINDIIGVRRCGKTYCMFQQIEELIRAGIPKSQILYLNIDDDRLQPLNGDELDRLLDTFRELYPVRDDERLYLFLDEIQNFPGWELWIKGIYDRKKNLKIVISGSNASLLSEEVANRLTGRHITTILYPFSFREYIVHHEIPIDLRTLPYSERRFEIKRLLNEFLHRGGFPEVILYPSADVTVLLQSYFDDIIFRDIVTRHGVRNPALFKDLAIFCISNIAKPHTYNSLRKLFSGFETISTDAIIRYLSYLEDAFLLISIRHYDDSLKKQMNKPRKLYCIDPGMMNAVSFRFSEDTGRLFENLVCIQLHRTGHEIYYWQDERGREVDFVIKTGLKSFEVIQVSMDISDPKTREREMKGLLSAMAHFGVSEGLILTSDLFEEETVSGKTIRYRPLWYWLLTQDEPGKR